MTNYRLRKEAWPDMAHSLIWLPEVLTRAGLKVSEVRGWEDRGWRGDVSRIFGVICHHTGINSRKNMAGLKSLINGRPAEPGLDAVPGPLAQLGLARDGTYYVVAAGRANHAGQGAFQGVPNGNSNFIGIEAENTGQSNDSPWPEVQMQAYHRGVAAILKHVRQGPEFCIGHKEYAPGRKPDPSFDMAAFRFSVAAILNGTAAPPILIPPAEPPTQPGGSFGRPTLRRGMSGERTKQVQLKVGVEVDGNFGAKTEAAVRNFQRTNNLVPDGIVGPKTWLALDNTPNLPPL